MDAVLAGRDSIVVLPTGGGKSLCFQAPAVVRAGLALVVSPLISLMKDQVDTLVGNGVPAALYNSSLDAGEKAAVVAGLRAGTLPAALRLARAAGRRRQRQLSRAARRRAASASSPSTKRTASASGATTSGPSTASSGGCGSCCPASAFTPTPPRRRRACGATSPTQLGLNDPLEFVGSFDRPNLVYRALPRATLKRQLLEVLARHRGEAGIIYCTSRREVDALAAWLTGIGITALPYHAGLSDARTQPQPGRVPERARRRHRRDGGLRHGHRSLGRAVRRARRRAAIARALPAGIGTRGPRRPRSRVPADLLDRRLHEVARDARAERRAHRRQRARCCGRWSATRRASAAAIGTCPSTSATGTPRTAAAPATSASTSSSRRPSRSCSRARSCRASRASGSDSARRTSPACCAARRASRSSARGHDKLSTFGLLPDASVAEVRGYIEQLIGARPAAADRRRVSGAGADGARASRC